MLPHTATTAATSTDSGQLRTTSSSADQVKGKMLINAKKKKQKRAKERRGASRDTD